MYIQLIQPNEILIVGLEITTDVIEYVFKWEYYGMFASEEHKEIDQ